ncbi:MAG: LacI family DNA-binding transcriptional regulator [Aggregatilineales bacterium]
MATRLDIEEIARRSGVSRSTVSRVLNNQSGVRSQTRDRVLEVIRAADYHPNQAARALTTRRTETLALAIPMALPPLFSDLFLTALVESICSAASQHGYLVMLWLGSSEAEERRLYQRLVRQNAIDGVLIASAPDNDWLIHQLVADHFPFAMVGRPTVKGVNYVDSDNRGAAREAVEHLIGLGYHRIGTISGPLNHVAGRDRTAGYGDALRVAGIAPDDSLIVSGDFTEAGAYQAMNILLAQNVDAVFVASDQMAFAAMQAISDAGKRIPEDVAVVGFDDTSRAESIGLTTVRQSPAASGQAVTKLLIEVCNQPDSSPRGVLLPTQLVIRQTCGAQLRTSKRGNNQVGASQSNDGLRP